ncbi:MAG: transposase [Bryobacteraceae bacterium]
MCFDEVELLIIYIDGMHFGEQCVLAAVGVDVEGRKHVLVLREGATENAEAAKDLLQHLVEHGVDPARRRLFIIDGSKALRTAINAVFGAETPVQRCRNHKLRNVLGRLPREQQGQTGSLMRAASKMNPKDGIAKFRQIAGWLEHDYPEAASALLEGVEECFTINRLDVPRSLHRCLVTSNIVDNPHSGVRSRTRECAAGVQVCRRAGQQPHSWKEKNRSARSWAFGIYGPLKRSSTDRSQLPGRWWRRIIMDRRSQLPTALETPSLCERDQEVETSDFEEKPV